MWRFLAILALGLSAAFQVGGPDGSIEDFIDTEMPASGVPGLAYAVVTDGNVTTVGARGVVEIGGDRNVTPDTAFLTGSISKSFTALAVMQLVEAGTIDLDTEVSHSLASFSGQPAGAITIRQLLSHTSGFSTLQGNASHTDITSGKGELARRVDQIAHVNPAYKPDQRSGILEHELPDSWSPDRSRQRAGIPSLYCNQHPGAGRNGTQLRR